MSITEHEERFNVLRHELKAWEKEFAAQNKGRKAGRDDIKADEKISQKYKEYNKLRAGLSSASSLHTPSKRTARHYPSQHIEQTPQIAPKPLTATPKKRKREQEEALEDVDYATENLSPQVPMVIGPTPQRDGIVLGLFDMLTSETPSKRRAVLGDAELNVPQTPSRKLHKTESEASLESRARGERTPLSSGKRFLLNQFVTPKKIKLIEEGTPTSTIRGLATPAFLRRENVLNAIEEVDETTPRPAPWKRRGLGRSLSAMIQAMKKDEDNRLDEEADMMREIEMEELGIVVSKKSTVPRVLVEDSQVPMRLGPDRGLESDDESGDEPETGPDGKPRRVWKKKGLKRQTRRVIMRPNITKAKPQLALQVQDDPGDDETDVAKTQVQADGTTSDYGLDDDESLYASDASHSMTKKRKPQAKKAEGSNDKANKDGVVKTAARKIKATANANYKRLKIKGKGATGGKGKLGRRR